MKAIFNELSDYAYEISLEPETPQEIAELLRLAANASAEKPVIRFSFKREPYCYIYLKKINPSSSTAKFLIQRA